MSCSGKDPLDRSLAAEPSFWRDARAQPARARRPPSGTSSDAQRTSSGSPASTTTPRPRCCGRRARRRLPGGAPHAQEARLRLPRPRRQVLLQGGRDRGRATSTPSASTTSRSSSSSACCRPTSRRSRARSPSFRKAMPVWLQEKLWIPSIIRKELEPYKGPIYFAEHHMSHAASAFLPSPFEEAAILTVDGVGEWATATLRRGQGQRHRALQGDPLPALPRPALQRVHLLPGLQGEQRRVQGDGPGAVRQARALRPDHEGDGPPAARTARSS